MNLRSRTTASRDLRLCRRTCECIGMRTGPAHCEIIAWLDNACERKSVEPMAAVTAPDRTAAQHQSLLHFSASRLGQTRRYCKVGETVCRRLRPRPIELDHRRYRFSKKGEHSVAWHASTAVSSVSGELPSGGVVVTRHHHASLPVAWRLYLPKGGRPP